MEFFISSKVVQVFSKKVVDCGDVLGSRVDDRDICNQAQTISVRSYMRLGADNCHITEYDINNWSKKASLVPISGS